LTRSCSPAKGSKFCSMISVITRLSMDIGIPQHLRDLGVKEADFPYMAEMALKDGNAFSNPRKGNEQEIAAIFRQAL
ncbi:iron-containing alcohol dehydrogenase, partial [Klebsiella pneumoniae]|uniref:iron-containing alcohol dehydrogenase n=1 Tax=Klebsiella pneumoniae TaxID=573 RepID=UPI00396AA98B